MSRYKIRPAYDKEGKIEVVAIECPDCGDIVFSRANHDYRTCTCEKVAIDGGFEYTKVSGIVEPFKLKIVQNKTELYNDWNNRTDKYGLIRKVSTKYDLDSDRYDRTNEISERKRKRNGYNPSRNRSFATLLEKELTKLNNAVKPVPRKKKKPGRKKVKKPISTIRAIPTIHKKVVNMVKAKLARPSKLESPAKLQKKPLVQKKKKLQKKV
jgi:ribosomal protein S27E